MRLAWSFWTKPFVHNKLAWVSEKHHLLAWVLSVETARRHYSEMSLFTDDAGARMLLDGLGLQFSYVSTQLNALDGHDPEWWALGKLYTYRAQTKAFIHIDSDVFLWKPLPERINYAPVFAQNPEYLSAEASYYRPQDVELIIGHGENGWMPEEWVWYRSADLPQKAESCGIIGGNRVDFINYYADLAFTMLEHPYNQPRWLHSRGKIRHTVLLEQYLLSACIEYHRGRNSSPFKGIHIQYLFDSMEEALSPAIAAQAGYTHLIAGAKKNKEIAGRLERRVMRDYPMYYERCIKYLGQRKRVRPFHCAGKIATM